jgi:signal transduction histidine kinase
VDGTEVAALRREIDRLRAANRVADGEVARLREAVRARDALLVAAGHEMRNAMGSILVVTTSLRFRAAREPGLPAWIGERLDLVARQSRGFVRRTTTLLDVSRLSSGPPSLSLASVCWTDVVLGIVEELELDAERAGCDVEVRHGAPVSGTWDRDALEQITFNLLSNALTHGAGRPVQIAVVREGDRGVLRVRLHGAGIGEADRARIFERFERAVRMAETPGIGLSLWIARQLARAHGGEIDIASVAGAGSVFTVNLPGARRESEHDELPGLSPEA